MTARASWGDGGPAQPAPPEAPLATATPPGHSGGGPPMPAPSRAARWSGLLGRARRGVGLLLLVGLLGCLGPPPRDAGRAPDSAVQRQLARIRDTALPPNYPARIAA